MKYLSNFALLVGFSAVLLSLSSPLVFAQGDAVDADDFLKIQPKVGAAPKIEVGEPTGLSDLEKGLALATAELNDKKILAQKVILAKKMHAIRTTREQVDSAVRGVSMALPAHERKGFIDAMSIMLNYNAIERISIDAMIETYTLKELDSMVEYFNKPEAISASKKTLSWARIVQPEISRMIDKAIMRIKTGQ